MRKAYFFCDYISSTHPLPLPLFLYPAFPLPKVYLRGIRNFQRPVVKELHGFRGDRTYAAIATDPGYSGVNSLLRVCNWYGTQWTLTSQLHTKCVKVKSAEAEREPPPPLPAYWHAADLPDKSSNPNVVQTDDLVKCQGDAAPNSVPFEFTPRYLSDLRWPYNVMQQLPHAKQLKLVVIVRNPTPRVWSAFFQTARPPMWKPEIFIDHVREEVRLMRRCYNSTSAFSLLTNEWPFHHSTSNMNVAQIRSNACRDPAHVYAALQRCVQTYARDPDQEPWFLKYTLAFGLMPRFFNPVEQAPFQGNVIRGIYVDQFINLLCAGFEPKNILVLTSGGFFWISLPFYKLH